MATAWQPRAWARINKSKRDPSLLLALAECGLLTTSQLCRLHFGSLGTCRKRLGVLRQLGVITSVRTAGNWAEECSWALTDRGAQLLAVLVGEPVRAGVWSKQVSVRALPHRQACAGFFTALLGVPDDAPHLVAVRHRGYQAFGPARPGEASTMWLGERSCRIVFGDNEARPWGSRTALVPDGAALIALETGGGQVQPIALEIDRGTESTRVLDDKLRRYEIVAGGGLAVLVCFTDPTVAASWQPPRSLVSVLVGDLPAHLADPWRTGWRAADGRRVSLADLAEHVQSECRSV